MEQNWGHVSLSPSIRPTTPLLCSALICCALLYSPDKTEVSLCLYKLPECPLLFIFANGGCAGRYGRLRCYRRGRADLWLVVVVVVACHCCSGRLVELWCGGQQDYTKEGVGEAVLLFREVEEE